MGTRMIQGVRLPPSKLLPPSAKATARRGRVVVEIDVITFPFSRQGAVRIVVMKVGSSPKIGNGAEVFAQSE
jgi:hypothetical protein